MIDFRNDYEDKGEKLFKLCFELLKDFVEIDKAYQYIILNDVQDQEPNNNIFSKYYHARWRNKNLGLKRLEEEMELPEGTKQKEVAQEIYSLYTWYIHVYKNRDYSLVDKPLPIDKKTGKLFADFAKEDEKMLNRLIKIRTHMWA